MNMQTLYILLGAYILGSLPSAYIVTRISKGVDIRQVGDGNMGAKNAFLSIGKLEGIIAGIMDIGKGALSILFARQFTSNEEIIFLAGVCAVLGHDFPIFLRFRGGQGMATMVGVFIILFPIPMVWSLSALCITLFLTRNWDLSSTVGFVLLFVLLWLSGQPVKRLLYIVILLPTLAVRKIMQAWQTRHALV